VASKFPLTLVGALGVNGRRMSARQGCLMTSVKRSFMCPKDLTKIKGGSEEGFRRKITPPSRTGPSSTS